MSRAVRLLKKIGYWVRQGVAMTLAMLGTFFVGLALLVSGDGEW